MGGLSITHWLILLAVVALVFGTSKLKNIGKDVGGAVKDFKDAVNDEEQEHANRVIDHKNTTNNDTLKNKNEQNV